jgi:hypothetical protein
MSPEDCINFTASFDFPQIFSAPAPLCDIGMV